MSGKNPWGQPGNGNNGGGKPPWGGGDMPPDLDDMLRRAQRNLGQVMQGADGGGKLFLILAVVVAALWLASGFYTIVPGENGVIQRFGAWSRTQANEGLGYRLPWPVESLTKVNVTEVRRMEIGFSERSGRNVTGQKQDVPEESLMLTSDANIVDIDLEVHWNIKSAEDFLFNIRDPENTIKKVAESAIREAVGQTQMFLIITEAREAVVDRAKAIMVENLDQYKSGVNITQVLIREAEVHPDVQDAFQDVQSAKQDAEDVKNRAGAYREDILPKARGEAIKLQQEAEAYRQSVIARAKGDADRFTATYQAYLGGQDVTKTRLYIETMEKVLQNAQTIILDERGTNGGGVVPYLPLNDLKPAAGGKTP